MRCIHCIHCTSRRFIARGVCVQCNATKRKTAYARAPLSAELAVAFSEKSRFLTESARVTCRCDLRKIKERPPRARMAILEPLPRQARRREKPVLLIGQNCVLRTRGTVQAAQPATGQA